jgi:hypothetical protein
VCHGVLWGVSHATSSSNVSQGVYYDWAAVNRNTCDVNEQVASEQDVGICNGQMVEGANDNAGQTVLATYPRQPFDFAGRTGTVEFDVSNNSQGPHAAWPTFVHHRSAGTGPVQLGSGYCGQRPQLNRDRF